jgi:Holliday junction resolvase
MPLFQSPADQARERALGNYLGTLWGWQMHHFPELDRVDWHAEDVYNRVTVAVIEHKGRRRVPMRRYPTVYVSKAKVRALQKFADAFHLDWRIDARFVVEWADALGWIPLWKAEARDFELVGNFTRDARELCHHVPVSQFTLLPLWPNHPLPWTPTTSDSLLKPAFPKRVTP